MNSTDSSQPREQHGPNLFLLFVTNAATVILVSSGFLGLVPNSPLTSLYQETIVESFPPEFVGPVNAFLESNGVPPISEARFTYLSEASGPDPVGWALEQAGVSMPATVASPVFDPAGTLLAAVGLPAPPMENGAPDPGAVLLTALGLTEDPQTAPEFVLDPASWLLGAAPPEMAANPPFDPAGLLLGYVLPPGTPMAGNPPLDPAGILLEAVGPWVTGFIMPPASPPSPVVNSTAVAMQTSLADGAATQAAPTSETTPGAPPAAGAVPPVVSAPAQPTQASPSAPTQPGQVVSAPSATVKPPQEPNPPTGTPTATVTSTVTATPTVTATTTATVTQPPADTAPYVINTSPFNGETGVAPTTDIVITFSEPVNVSVSQIWVGYSEPSAGAYLTSMSVSGSGTAVITIETGSMAPGFRYDVGIQAAIISDTDLNDPPDTMMADYNFSFYVSAPPPADAAPYVVNTSPSNGATGVSPAADIVITFSEPVNVSASGIQLIYYPFDGPVEVSTIVSGSGTNQITLDPTGDLPVDLFSVNIYAALISDTDLIDPPDTLAADYSFGFNVSAPPPALPLYFYGYTFATAGNLGGRSGADALCASSSNKPAGYSQYRAFISTSAVDSIANMPANYGFSASNPVYGNGSMLFANNWADLLDGSLPYSFNAANINGNPRWWSGAESYDGSAIPTTSNCAGWTDGSSDYWGNYGSGSSTGSDWMYASNVACNTPSGLICLAIP